MLEEVAAEIPELRLVLVGAPPFTLSDLALNIQTHPWSLETEAGLVGTFDIGLFTLPNTPYARARGGGKLLVYMAAGVAILAPPYGIGGQLVQDGVNGLLVVSKNDLLAALCKLADDRELLAELRGQARDLATSKYSYDAYLEEFLGVLLANNDVAETEESSAAG